MREGAVVFEPPDGVTRLWMFYSPDGDEQCVGAVLDAVKLGYPRPAFVATVSFKRLAAAVKVIHSLDANTGVVRRFLSRGVLDGPGSQPDEQRPCLTIDDAIRWLDAKRDELVTRGWAEGELDPLRDHD